MSLKDYYEDNEELSFEDYESGEKLIKINEKIYSLKEIREKLSTNESKEFSNDVLLQLSNFLEDAILISEKKVKRAKIANAIFTVLTFVGMGSICLIPSAPAILKNIIAIFSPASFLVGSIGHLFTYDKHTPWEGAAKYLSYLNDKIYDVLDARDEKYRFNVEFNKIFPDMAVEVDSFSF